MGLAWRSSSGAPRRGGARGRVADWRPLAARRSCPSRPAPARRARPLERPAPGCRHGALGRRARSGRLPAGTRLGASAIARAAGTRARRRSGGSRARRPDGYADDRLPGPRTALAVRVLGPSAGCRPAGDERRPSRPLAPARRASPAAASTGSTCGSSSSLVDRRRSSCGCAGSAEPYRCTSTRSTTPARRRSSSRTGATGSRTHLRVDPSPPCQVRHGRRARGLGRRPGHGDEPPRGAGPRRRVEAR